MTTTVLKATDLCKTFSNESVQQHVLKNLNLEIRKGDFTVIMGDSGAGKSTLLYSLSGMDRPSLGAVLFGNEDISNYSNDKLAIFRRKHCGFVFQQNYLNDTMSVLDNIIVSGLLKSRDRKAIAARAKKLLKQVGLDESCYNKFLNQGGDSAERADFTYKGRKPRSTEETLVMICDSIEAASRSLTEYTPEAYSAFVEKIVGGKLEEGQLNESDLTLHELRTVKEALKTYLAQMHHERIAYPDRNKTENKQ